MCVGGGVGVGGGGLHIADSNASVWRKYLNMIEQN